MGRFTANGARYSNALVLQCFLENRFRLDTKVPSEDDPPLVQRKRIFCLWFLGGLGAWSGGGASLGLWHGVVLFAMCKVVGEQLECCNVVLWASCSWSRCAGHHVGTKFWQSRPNLDQSRLEATFAFIVTDVSDL